MPTYDADSSRENDVPFGNDDDFEIEIGGGGAPKLDADAIERDNGFRKIPPGDHVLSVQSFFLGDDEKVFPVMLAGRIDSFKSRQIRVRFSLASDPRSQISDVFYLPPSVDSERAAYYDGVPENARSGDKGGFQAKKFWHFASRLGLVDPSTNDLTSAGRRPSQWKGRAIVATVEAGRGTYTNRDGVDVPRDNQVKLFSYRPASAEAMAGAASQAHAGHDGGSRPAMAGAGSSGRSASSQRAAVGLDDL